VPLALPTIRSNPFAASVPVNDPRSLAIELKLLRRIISSSIVRGLLECTLFERGFSASAEQNIWGAAYGFLTAS